MISIRVKNPALKRGKFKSPQKSGFMSFSQKTDYGLFLLSYLADASVEKPVSLREVAKSNSLSFYFLQKVALELRKAGLIEAVRGKHGGYILSKNPTKIRLVEILEALEGPFALMQCLQQEANKHCAREDGCNIRSGIGMINELILQTLSKFSLSDFINSKWQQKK